MANDRRIIVIAKFCLDKFLFIFSIITYYKKRNFNDIISCDLQYYTFFFSSTTSSFSHNLLLNALFINNICR